MELGPSLVTAYVSAPPKLSDVAEAGMERDGERRGHFRVSICNSGWDLEAPRAISLCTALLFHINSNLGTTRS